MIKIGILEDNETIYYPWKVATIACHTRCQAIWIPNFEQCFTILNQIDILVADWEIEDYDLREVDTLDDYIEEIATKFKGPIVLYSSTTPPKHLQKYFTQTLSSKNPPDIDSFIQNLKPSLLTTDLK